jgi:lipopolysaccharide transport system ATP-binding protein
VNDRTAKSSAASGQSSETAAAENSQLKTADSRASGPEYVWALKDINLEVAQGEILGIIGRNGAGKSTLLKLLSRVTAPTTGSIKTRGRIASLLEVGTGFHPELTGRENIYLNGAILGMKRHEVTAQLDEIVDFSGCAKYLDTPVKRYSSGMMVRLGFAVAAHLQCDILIVDEVLAVGDANFQNQCIRKMQDVAGGGRTVLFVSHNLQSVNRLCSNAILVDQGGIAVEGRVPAVIQQYTRDVGISSTCLTWESEYAPGNADAKLMRVEVLTSSGPGNSLHQTCHPIEVRLHLKLYSHVPGLCVGFDLLNSDGLVVLRTYHTDLPDRDALNLVLGSNTLECSIPAGLLNAGYYVVQPRIGVHGAEWLVQLDSGPTFRAVLSHGESSYWSVLDETNRPGCISPVLPWVLY